MQVELHRRAGEMIYRYEQILSSVESYGQIVDFITKGRMEETLSSIGDVHTEAAKEALAKIKISNDKKAPVWSAVTHLEVAHVAYRKLYIDRGSQFRAASFLLAIYKDCGVMSLMAECEIYLKEGGRANDAANKAVEARYYYEKLLQESKAYYEEAGDALWSSETQFPPPSRHDLSIMTSLFNLREWSAAIKASRARVTMEQVYEFQRRISLRAKEL